jgi:hypothetical protein
MPGKTRDKFYDLSHPLQARPPTAHPRPPSEHAWRIDKPDGTHETIGADFCILSHNGALAFYRKLPLPHDSLLLRAVGPSKWIDAQLADDDFDPPPCA